MNAAEQPDMEAIAHRIEITSARLRDILANGTATPAEAVAILGERGLRHLELDFAQLTGVQLPEHTPLGAGLYARKKRQAREPTEFNPSNLLSTVIGRIRQAMIAQSMQPKELAQRSGLSRARVENIVQQSRTITIDEALALAEAVGMALADLVSYTPGAGPRPAVSPDWPELLAMAAEYEDTTRWAKLARERQAAVVWVPPADAPPTLVDDQPIAASGQTTTTTRTRRPDAPMRLIAALHGCGIGVRDIGIILTVPKSTIGERLQEMQSPGPFRQPVPIVELMREFVELRDYIVNDL